MVAKREQQPGTRTDARPERALMHPAWIVALVVLVVNDHLLKGADILPAAMTGKLSDFAGLLVAPMLLAVALRVHRRSTLAACHIAVGVVFAVLQLSPGAAALWDSAMTLVGPGWKTWSDPTDMLALPMLLVSWSILVPAAFTPLKGGAVGALRRAGEGLAFGVGIVCCVATSPPDVDCNEEPEACNPSYCPNGQSFDDNGECVVTFTSDIYLHNGTGQEQIVRARPLKSTIELDCDTVLADPGSLLTLPLFDAASTWTMPVGTSLPLESRSFNGCHALLLEGDGLPRGLVFWRDGDYARKTIQATQLEADKELPDGGITIVRNTFDNLAYEETGGGPSLLYKLLPQTSPADRCLPAPGSERVAWSLVKDDGLKRTLSDIELGGDGCYGMTLDPGDHPTLRPQRWYVCVPEGIFPFKEGDAVTFEEERVGTNTTLTVRQVPVDQENWKGPAVLLVSRGTFPAQGIDSPGFTHEFLTLESCGYAIDETCGTVSRAAEVRVLSPTSGDAVKLGIGEQGSIEVDAETMAHIALVSASTQILSDNVCTDGPTALGEDTEVVIAIEPMEDGND